MIPGKVRIGGLDIPIEMDPALDSFGEYDPNTRRIRIAPGMDPAVRRGQATGCRGLR
jgi:hypothetical protein